MSAEAARSAARTTLPSRAFVGVEQATWLVPRGGVTVAGQRRIATGLRWLYTGREYVPSRERIRPAADTRELRKRSTLSAGATKVAAEMRIAIAIFDGAEELDFVGPWEVLAAWRFLYPDDVELVLVGEDSAAVSCAKGMHVIADTSWDELGDIDVLVYPGGRGTRAQLGDDTIRARLRDLKAQGTLMTSVCTGALVYADAGLLDGRPATTYWSAFDELLPLGRDITPCPDERFVDDRDVITAAGVSAGIDMALHLVGRLGSPEKAREVRRYIQYDPQPPY
jgi:transcriptional regulator GlxA family with amidase domain